MSAARTATQKPTATTRKAQPAKATAKPAPPAKANEANVPAQEQPKPKAVRKTGVVKANAFAQLAKDHGYAARTVAQGESGATVTVTRGRERMTFVWADNKLVTSTLPTWEWLDEKKDKVLSSLVVHNVGEAKRIFGVPAEEAGPKKAAAVRNDATITGTNRTSPSTDASAA